MPYYGANVFKSDCFELDAQAESTKDYISSNIIAAI